MKVTLEENMVGDITPIEGGQPEKKPEWTFRPGEGWLRDGEPITAREEAEYIWESMPPRSRYDFRLDINDPKINQYYRIYKERLGIPPHIPVSDRERVEFEIQYLTAVVEKRRTQSEKGSE